MCKPVGGTFFSTSSSAPEIVSKIIPELNGVFFLFQKKYFFYKSTRVQETLWDQNNFAILKI